MRNCWVNCIAVFVEHLGIFATENAKFFPKLGAVIQLHSMCKFVKNNVFDHFFVEKHEIKREVDILSDEQLPHFDFSFLIKTLR